MEMRVRLIRHAKIGLEKDEIAARQLHALPEHLGPGEKLRLTDVHQLFRAMLESGMTKA